MSQITEREINFAIDNRIRNARIELNEVLDILLHFKRPLGDLQKWEVQRIQNLIELMGQQEVRKAG